MTEPEHNNNPVCPAEPQRGYESEHLSLFPASHLYAGGALHDSAEDYALTALAKGRPLKAHQELPGPPLRRRRRAVAKTLAYTHSAQRHTAQNVCGDSSRKQETGRRRGVVATPATASLSEQDETRPHYSARSLREIRSLRGFSGCKYREHEKHATEIIAS